VADLRTRGIDVPLVIMTAGPSAAHWARQLNVAGSIAKPFKVNELVATVERFATVA